MTRLGALLLLLALAGAVVDAAGASRCDVGFLGHCYRLTTEATPWMPYPPQCGGWLQASLSQAEWGYLCKAFGATSFGENTWFGLEINLFRGSVREAFVDGADASYWEGQEGSSVTTEYDDRHGRITNHCSGVNINHWFTSSRPDEWPSLCKGPPTRVALIATTAANNGALQDIDTLLVDRLGENWSYVYKNLSQVVNSTLNGYDAIFITGNGNPVFDTFMFATTRTPIVVLAGSAPVMEAVGMHLASVPASSLVSTFSVVEPDSPLAGGLSGTVGMLGTLFMYSISVTGATFIATGDDPRNAVLLVAQRSTIINGRSLPGRRICFPVTSFPVGVGVTTPFVVFLDAIVNYVTPRLQVAAGPSNPFTANYPIIFSASARDGNGDEYTAPFNSMFNLVIVDMAQGGAPLSLQKYYGSDSTVTQTICRSNDTLPPFYSYAPGSKWYAEYTTGGAIGFLLAYVNTTSPNFTATVTAEPCEFPYPLPDSVDFAVHLGVNASVHFIRGLPSVAQTVPYMVNVSFVIGDDTGATLSGARVRVDLNNTESTVASMSYYANGEPMEFTALSTQSAGIKLFVFVDDVLFEAITVPLKPGYPSRFLFDPYPTPNSSTEPTIGPFQVLIRDVFGNGYGRGVGGTYHIRALGSLPAPTMTSAVLSTLFPFTVQPGATFSGGGCFALATNATVPSLLFQGSIEAHIHLLMPQILNNVTTDENLPIHISVPYIDATWTHVFVNNTCGGNAVLQAPLASASVDEPWALMVDAQDYEALPGGVCEVSIRFNGCEDPSVYRILVNNVHEPPILRDQTFHFTGLGPHSIALGDIAFVENGTPREQLTFYIDTMPGTVTIYPDTPNATSVADLGNDLPLTTTGANGYLVPATSAGRVTLVYTAGYYTDQFYIMILDAAGVPSSRASVNVNVSLACLDPTVQTYNDLGVCICAAGAFINLDSQCQSCAAGTYYSGQKVANPCLACPANGVCPGGVTPPSAAIGFYCTLGQAIPAAYDRCIPQAACPGNCRCRTGHTGPLCSTCEKNFYVDNSLCTPCPSTSAILLILLAIAMVIVCFALIKVARRSTNYFTSVSVGFNFLQIISILAEFRLQWPPFVLTFLESLNVLNFNINVVQPACAFAGGNVPYFPLWIFKLILPILFLCVFLIANIVTRLYAAARNSINEIQRPTLSRLPKVSEADVVILKNASINAFFTVLVLLYLNLISTALEIFSCDEDNRMIKDASYQCYSPAWNTLAGIGITAAIIYGLGIPAVFYAVLRSNRDMLLKELTIIKFGLLYRQYKHHLFLWEIIILWRKLLIILGLLFFSSHPIGAAAFALCALVLALGLHLFFQPYVSKRVNYLETVHLTCGSVVLLFGLILAAVTSGPHSESSITGLGVFVILIIAANCVGLAYVIAQELRYQFRLVRRGVQGGFASDEVVVNEFFFKHGFFMRQNARNMLGATSTVVLTSGPACRIRVEYVDARKTLLDGKRKSEALQSWVQSDTYTHQVVTVFNQPGRYGLLVYAWLDGEPEPVLDITREDTPQPHLSLGGRALAWLKSTYRRNAGGTVPTFAFTLNCDVQPRNQLTFPKMTPLAENKNLVLMHPNFYELTPQARTTFRLRGSPIQVALSRTRPAAITDPGLILFNPPDASGKEGTYMDSFTVASTFAKTGVMHLWCQFVLPKREVAYDASTVFNSGVFSSMNSKGAGEAVDFASYKAPAPVAPDVPFEEDDDATKAAALAGRGCFVRIASFEVLDRHAGWTESGVVESELMGMLVRDESAAATNTNSISGGTPSGAFNSFGGGTSSLNSFKGGPMNVASVGSSRASKDVEMGNVNPLFDGAPPLLSDAFTARRGVLYSPRLLRLKRGVPVNFEVSLPGAMVYVVNITAPTTDVDGTVLFKRDDGIYAATASFDIAGPVHLWVRLATADGRKFGSFEVAVTFDVV